MTQSQQSPAMPPLEPGMQPTALRPPRGGAILALGILGLVVCFICGIIAWVMGNTDLREMGAGRMDPSGRGLTNAGRICGIVSVILSCAGAAIWLIVVVVMAAAS